MDLTDGIQAIFTLGHNLHFKFLFSTWNLKISLKLSTVIVQSFLPSIFIDWIWRKIQRYIQWLIMNIFLRYLFIHPVYVSNSIFIVYLPQTFLLRSWRVWEKYYRQTNEVSYLILYWSRIDPIRFIWNSHWYPSFD